MAAARPPGAEPPRRQDLHVHGHRAVDEPRGGDRRRGVGRSCSAGTTRRSDRCSRRTRARRSARLGTASSWASTGPTPPSRARLRSSGASPTSASSTVSRPACGSACTHRAPRRSATRSRAAASTRRRGSRHWPRGRDPREQDDGRLELALSGVRAADGHAARDLRADGDRRDRLAVSRRAPQRIERLPEQYFTALLARVAAAAAEGEPLVDLGRGNPEIGPPAHVVRGARRGSRATGRPRLRAVLRAAGAEGGDRGALRAACTASSSIPGARSPSCPERRRG